MWHVEQVGVRYLVSRGELSVSEWFGDYRTALDYAASLNIMENHILDFEVLQSLMEQAQTMSELRRRSRAMVERYSKHEAFQPDNSSEDIFAKLARIIEFERNK